MDKRCQYIEQNKMNVTYFLYRFTRWIAMDDCWMGPKEVSARYCLPLSWGIYSRLKRASCPATRSASICAFE